MQQIPQARIHGVNDLRLDHIPAPVCGPDDVVVRVQQCGICGSDLGYLGMGGLTGPDTPMPIGHELWGEISEAGANVTHVSIGDRVVVQPLDNGDNIGNGGTEGGFTPLLLVRKAVIYGAGPIGLSIVQMLVHRGLSDIVVVDLSTRRLDAAQAMGATPLRGDDPALGQRLMELHGESSFFGMSMPGSTVFFEATGARAVFEGIVQIAGPGSRICLTGVHKEAATVDLVMLLAKELSIVAALAYAQEFDEVIAILRRGEINPASMITHRFPLSQIESAFSAARDTEHAIKVMIDCQS